jgi:hypothetical protein
MNMRLAALVLLTCAPMLAWERRVALRGTDWIDTPTLHSLEFYKTNRCVDHAPMERRLDQSCKPDRIDLKQVGIVGKWVIYDLTYYDSTGEVDAESVLVQTGPQQVREILYRDCEEGRGSTTKTAVLHISGTTMAYSRYDRAEEYGVWSAEYFFSFRSRGDKVMRLEPWFGLARNNCRMSWRSSCRNRKWTFMISRGPRECITRIRRCPCGTHAVSAV